jgi:hypothetical protein
MENINLQLSLDEVNMLLNSLGHQPYAQVYALIQKIQQQATIQLPASGNEKAVAQSQSQN